MKRYVRGIAVLLAVALLLTGCRRPTTQDRDNRRVLEQVLTAITLKNSRLLEESASKVLERHEAAELSDDDFDDLSAIVAKARVQDWAAAEADAYAFRKRRPFVRPGE